MTEIQKVQQWVDQSQARFLQLIPQGIDGARWFEILKSEVGGNPDLRNCEPESVFRAAIEAAKLGLDFSGTLQQAHLIPYGKKCTLIVGFRGLMALMRKGDPNIQTIEARVVRKNDTLLLDDSILHFRSEPLAENRGEIRGVFARIIYADGSQAYEVMTQAEVEKIRNMGKYKNAVWNDHWEAMARKTVIRRLAKYVPLDTVTRDAISKLEQDEFEIQAHVTPPPQQGVDATLAAISAPSGQLDNPPLFEDGQEAEPVQGNLGNLESDAP